MSNSCQGEFNIWTDIVTPLVISPILLILKIAWDRYTKKQDETLLLKNKSKLEKISTQLKNYFWPLYILLLRDYDLWSQFTLFDEQFYEFVESDTESDISDSEEPILRCCFVEKRTIDDKIITYKCNNPIAKNTCIKGPKYCLKHFNKRNIQNIEITTYNEQDNESKLISINVDDSCENTAIDFSDVDIESGESKVRLTVLDNDYAGNFTGNGIGEIDGLNNKNVIDHITIDKDTRDNLTKIMLANHNDINDIILKNISTGEPNSTIGKQLIKYLKFITIVKSTVQENSNLNPSKFNAPYPKKLLPLIEKKVFSLQKEYNALIDTFYYK